MLEFFPMVSALLAHETRVKTKGEIAVSLGLYTSIQIIEPQPVVENDLKLLEPGERVGNWRKTWTETAIVPTDVIQYGGKVYRVHQVDDRAEGNFRRVVMREKVLNVA